MNYLLDTNIILELLLEQERADEVEQLLQTVSPATLFLSEFSMYSLGIILFRYQRHDVFLQMVEDLLGSGIQILQVMKTEMPDVSAIAQKFNLDFDDAYQYTLAVKHDLTIISFDHDFNRTRRGCKTPKEVLDNTP